MGHIFSDMEIMPSKLAEYAITEMIKFQLGHIFSDMEMPIAMSRWS